MKCTVDIRVSLEDLFGYDPIKVSKRNHSISVNLYECIEQSLISDIEMYGLYENFPDAIDKVTKDTDDEELIDEFVAWAKYEVLQDIKDHKLKIVNCNVIHYGDFEVTVDIKFNKLWKQFLEGQK